MGESTYYERLYDRLNKLLAAETRLPCPFKIARVYAPQTDWQITFYLEPTADLEGVFEAQDVFADMQRRMETEFKNDPLYFGISIGSPHRFLGQRHLAAMREQERQQEDDKKRYRRIRLKGTE